ncbi:Parkin coregulated gene protein [Phytophthora megakarya]|uniref:Parkin coregulated gene protein n=1 Tax=Phytophthora megakarya TaxID=4795 RepID=A0A225VBL0_9STRA|nr:Parkin coregulated gene protein [Phytophthora megakarya]
MRGYAADNQVLSLDSKETGRATSRSGSSRPNTSGGRSKKTKLSEFRQYLKKEELPLLIETRHGIRRVTWTANLEQLDFAHFLPISLSGLQEQLDPYGSFAFDAVMALLESGRRDTRVLRALPQVVQHLKSALCTRDKAIVHRVLLVLQQLAVCKGVGSALTDYYRSLLPLCNILQDKHLGTGDSATKELVTEVLETMEAYGKDDAHLMIQQYVPAFQNCCGA